MYFLKKIKNERISNVRDSGMDYFSCCVLYLIASINVKLVMIDCCRCRLTADDRWPGHSTCGWTKQTHNWSEQVIVMTGSAPSRPACQSEMRVTRQILSLKSVNLRINSCRAPVLRWKMDAPLPSAQFSVFPSDAQTACSTHTHTLTQFLAQVTRCATVYPTLHGVSPANLSH